jgi:hypothetical protein
LAGSPAFELVGQVEQVGASFTLRGYLTHLAGVPDGALFRRGGRSEATARLTVAAQARLRTRSVIGNLFVITAVGRLRIHLNPGGASFAAPASFARGPVVAASNLRVQSVINVQAPDAGIATVSGNLAQTVARELPLGGRRYRFGRVRLGQRVELTGQGQRLEPTLPRATIVVAGSAVATG